MVLFDADRRKRWTEEPLAVKEGFVSSVAFSTDGKTVAAGYGGVNGGGVVPSTRTVASGGRRNRSP